MSTAVGTDTLFERLMRLDLGSLVTLQEPVMLSDWEMLRRGSSSVADALEDGSLLRDVAAMGVCTDCYTYKSCEDASRPSAGDWQRQLHVFRKNIALRTNRVLDPSRSAHIYTDFISACIRGRARRVALAAIAYVGIPPARFNAMPADSHAAQTSSSRVLDLGQLATYVAGTMLDLDLARLQWEQQEGEKEGEEPLQPRQRGDATSEWFYKQVEQPLRALRAQDMTLAVFRLALRYHLDRLQRGHLEPSELIIRMKPVRGASAGWRVREVNIPSHAARRILTHDFTPGLAFTRTDDTGLVISRESLDEWLEANPCPEDEDTDAPTLTLTPGHPRLT
ncbi:unnamed protein product [Vitrella brassicaformis CCMP3155]|uniref:Uncharacterized protein n=1 Tax=Vitrella brassicaformis (strain CCMP3155) TaxID=1169540 RepID=A0A0G4EDH7_VITBC|nr:unnamed protein product [Vitrella brassicaformis CCMP3155]|eukprot:CEL93411.1 unnamed protein product [Vitrella brassicaformis CCMP3155]